MSTCGCHAMEDLGRAAGRKKSERNLVSRTVTSPHKDTTNPVDRRVRPGLALQSNALALSPSPTDFSYSYMYSSSLSHVTRSLYSMSLQTPSIWNCVLL